MKKYLLIFSAAIVAFASCQGIDDPQKDEDDGRLKAIITFEDPTLDGGLNYWVNKIDNSEYDGSMLYSEDEYTWTDTFTGLSHTAQKANWGTEDKPYWGWDSGAAISNYVTNKKDANYTEQLSIYTSSINGGNGNSSKFAVYTGHDWGDNTLPEFTFEYPTIIMGMFVNNTAYALGYVNSSPIETGEYAEVVINAVKVDGSKVSSKFTLADNKSAVSSWTWWSLESLGEIVSFTFNVTGNIDNGYGFDYPAYFAFDDISVSVRK